MRRIGGTAILLFFVAALVAPVYAAMSACGMPCCHDEGAAYPCSGCTITAAQHDDAVVVTTMADAVAPAPVAVVRTVAPQPQRVMVDSDAPRFVDRPLHLVHSVFLI